MITTVFIAALILASADKNIETAQPATRSLCGQIEGKSPHDRQNLSAFCSKGLVPGSVVGAIAMDSILWLKVSREMADAMRRDRLSAEQIVKTWMLAWRTLTGRKAVTVTVEWQDVEVAKGSTSLLGSDSVTIR